MLQEPLLLIIALFLLFVLVIIYVRLDFSINKDEASENRLRIAGLVDKVLSEYHLKLFVIHFLLFVLDDYLTCTNSPNNNRPPT